MGGEGAGRLGVGINGAFRQGTTAPEIKESKAYLGNVNNYKIKKSRSVGAERFSEGWTGEESSDGSGLYLFQGSLGRRIPTEILDYCVLNCDRGWQAFSIKGQIANMLEGLCHSYSTLPLSHEKSPRQYSNKWMWLHSSKALFI